MDEFYCPPSKLNENEHGGVAVARNRKVVRVDPIAHEAYLADGTKIKYDKCLIATGKVTLRKYSDQLAHFTIRRHTEEPQRN